MPLLDFNKIDIHDHGLDLFHGGLEIEIEIIFDEGLDTICILFLLFSFDSYGGYVGIEMIFLVLLEIL